MATTRAAASPELLPAGQHARAAARKHLTFLSYTPFFHRDPETLPYTDSLRFDAARRTVAASGLRAARHRRRPAAGAAPHDAEPLRYALS
ncbi:hypothetical protein ACFORO_18610 [Amycolatopsis halotolerans]|uniref:Uncharacterized protein n=1 Tax=Amycolatopsis halotolerans TaxID=330083 RepID=A0ABV7QFW8_9PSEU